MELKFPIRFVQMATSHGNASDPIRSGCKLYASRFGQSTATWNIGVFIAFMNFKLNKQKRKNALNLRIGIGLAFLTKPF